MENKNGGSINIAAVRTSTARSYEMLVRRTTPTPNNAIGAAKLLKVIAGDRIHASVDYYYSVANANNSPANGLTSLITTLANAITSSTQVSGALKDGASALSSAMSGNVPLGSLLNTPNSTSGSNNAPKAYLNILFFDDQFKPDVNSSRVFPVAYALNTKSTILKTMANAITAGKNGYAYVLFQQRE